MKLFFIKREGHFQPLYNSDQEAYDKLKNNVQYMAEIKQPRNIEHHRLVFAEANFAIFHSLETSFWKNKDSYFLIKAAMREAGYVEPEYKLNGDIIFKVKSIAFENMAEDEFSELHEKILPFFAIVGNCTIQDILDNYHEFM